MKYLKPLLPLAAAALLVSGCKPAPSVVRLATTTSVQDTGLLDALAADFQKDGKYKLQAVAVGSGQAMQLGMTGEADILWVHSPEDEAKFMAEGYGSGRTTFMHNDFIIAGPAEDPARIKGLPKAADAFRKIAASKSIFVSRADKSGTNKMELKLWAEAKARPAGDRYVETGQGMGATLLLAGEKKAYTLVDRSTYLAMKDKAGLDTLCFGDPELINRYSLIPVSPQKFPKVNAAGAKAFLDFMLSAPVRAVIENYGQEKYGQRLFFWEQPDAVK